MKSTWKYRKKIIAVAFIFIFAITEITAYLLQYNHYNKKVTLDASAFTAFSPDPEIQLCIDDIYTWDGYTYIEGWMLKENSSLRPSDINVIIYDSEKGTYIQMPTSSVSRSDLIPTYGKKYSNFGFVGSINNKHLSTSTYTVFIQYQLEGETPLQPTGQTFMLEDLLNE